jgi:acetoin utilization deacetylase AcuC-like enzyme
MTCGLLHEDIFHEHVAPGYHPERPERLEAALDGLRRSGALDGAVRIPGRPADPEELGRVHAPDYVSGTLRALESGAGFLDPDTFFSADTHRAALEAAGGGIDLVRAVHERRVDWGFALVRPPGHHASWHRARGFCIFNNIAVATAALLAGGSARRVAIVDWDVHHGNGTQDQFWDRPDVLFCSLHQWPHYPGSGLSNEIGGDAARGRTVNIPFPGGCGDGDYLFALDKLVIPLLDAFQPDHLVVSAGFDAHRRDPLAGMELSSTCYGEMARRLAEAAGRLCQGRLTFFLEGGYDLEALSEGVAAVARAASAPGGGSTPAPITAASRRGEEVVERTVSHIRDHWPGIF